MAEATLFTPDCVLADIKVDSRKQLFQDMSRALIASHGLDVACRDIVAAAMERERLGSTGVGNGVALPHSRIEGMQDVKAAFARIDAPVDFDSIDDRPVDLVCFLLAPADAAGAHLRALARVSRLLRREDIRKRLRAAPGAEAMFTILTDETREVTAA